MSVRSLYSLFVITAFITASFPLRVEAQTNGVIYQIPATEYNALTNLYADTAGANWKNSSGWTDANATNWFGVTISGVQYDGSGNVRETGHVVSLELHFNQLAGNISTNLDGLSRLTNLDLAVNQLTGTIPDSLGNLSQLRSLYLPLNSLTGSIPATLGSLSQLQQLDLHANGLTGSIPASLGDLPQLQNLDLSQNQLTGYIPAPVELSQLQNLALDHNSLTGRIPATLGGLSHLITLALDDNQFTGSIPGTLGNLSQLQSLGLSGNFVSGDVPDFTAFTNVTLDLGGNYLNIRAGSQSLANINAMIAAGNTVNFNYMPQGETYVAITADPSDPSGFYITGAPGVPLTVRAGTNLILSTWTTVQNCTLTNGSIHFSDPKWTNYPHRFYRISSP